MREESVKRGSGAAKVDQETARRLVEAFAGPAAGIAAMFAPDSIYTSVIYGRLVGRDAILAALSRLDQSLGGLTREVQDVVVDGPFVAIRYLVRAVHDREYQGIPPTGRDIETRGIVIFRLQDGLVAECWNSMDLHGRLAQMRAAHAPQLARVPVAEIDAACPPPTRSELETIVREFFTKVWSAHPSPGALLADNVVFHPSLGRTVTGIVDVEAINAAWWTAFPDMRQRRGEILISGDLAATWYSATGTDLGGFNGNAPTGRPVAFEGHIMLRVNCGRIVEIWSATDVARVMEQLGHESR